MKKLILIAALCTGIAGAAEAGPAADASVASVNDNWGAEIGASYRFGEMGFRITPTIGAFIDDGADDLDWFGRVEMSYELPILLEIGIGGRIDDEDVRPYGFLGYELAPLIGLKANAGDDYFALGLTLNY